MNPAFILIVLLAVVALWFLLSFAFKPLGKFFYRIWKDAKDAINEEDNAENKNKKESTEVNE